MNYIYSSLRSSVWGNNNTRDESINSEIIKKFKKEKNDTIAEIDKNSKNVETKMDSSITTEIDKNSKNVETKTDLSIGHRIHRNTVPKSSGLPKKRKRLSIKKLSTCNTCGHYRFAKRNKKNVVNEDYPYEHSSQGGCPVPMTLHRCETDKLVRVCTCLPCTKAASKFKSDLFIKKKPQQSAEIRSPIGELNYSFPNDEFYANDPDDFEY